ncbi:MAG: DAK2 domain-containing protein [Oscillospiraceae bacterium]|nr:DAK2 domain-containing protein [Oscillospiraceae bacterium]
MQTRIIDGAMFANMVRCGTANLAANRQIVNDLNVFPIPDGDTGDNMYMTMDSGAVELRNQSAGSLSDVAASAAKGMLLGARGNSGVILSRIFAGISHGLKGVEQADLPTFSKAFRQGVEEAYRAVSVPVEGTILTVYKDAVRYADGQLTPDSTAESFFRDFLEELRRSLDRTPELLAVLKEAGVVDSGGAGFIYIAEGMQNALTGTEPAAALPAEAPQASQPDVEGFTEDSVLEFGYCTEFLLRLQRSKVDLEHFDLNVILDWLNSVGNSVVCFRDGSIVKVHVHTMRPGDILNEMQRYGEFLKLKIENMTLQHNETTVRNNYRPAKPKLHKAYGIVTVAAGAGIRETFASLGCDQVVDGGQSMNPAAEDFLRAFDEINADTILVFPNNGNVILTARQAAELYDKAKVCIVPTKTIGEGYAAISMLDTGSGDTEAILAELEEVIAGVVTGHVSAANRETVKDGVAIHPGHYIGFAGDTIYVDDPDRAEAVVALADRLRAGSYDILLLLAGQAVDPREARQVEARLKAALPRTEVISLRGDQPVYDYIMILE